MSDHIKNCDNFQDMIAAAQPMGNLQTIHNVIRPYFQFGNSVSAFVNKVAQRKKCLGVRL